MTVRQADISVDYEKVLSLIPGVMAVRVVVDDGEIAETHILGDTTRHPMQLVRDIESCLLTRFGVRIDHKKISVAQIQPTQPQQPRLVLSSVNLSISGNEAEVRAELQYLEKSYSGTARGAATHRGRLVLAAQAVLAAVAELLPAGFRVALETLDTMSMGGERTVLVLVSLLQGTQSQNLAGAAFVRRDETEAAGRATLAAINRRMELLVH